MSNTESAFDMARNHIGLDTKLTQLREMMRVDMTDLEWLAAHLGWTELFYERGDLWGVKPGDHILNDGYSRVPHYDQSIDLMVELVTTRLKSLPQKVQYLELIARHDEGLYNTDRITQAEFNEHNAPASLRLKAYRKVMDGIGTCSAEGRT